MRFNRLAFFSFLLAAAYKLLHYASQADRQRREKGVPWWSTRSSNKTVQGCCAKSKMTTSSSVQQLSSQLQPFVSDVFARVPFAPPLPQIRAHSAKMSEQGLSLKNTHHFLDGSPLQSLTGGGVGGGCAQGEERLLWFAQLCFYLPHCCFRDWLVDEGELGLKCWTRMSGADNHLQAVNCKFDDGAEAITDEITCLSWLGGEQVIQVSCTGSRPAAWHRNKCHKS